VAPLVDFRLLLKFFLVRADLGATAADHGQMQFVQFTDLALVLGIHGHLYTIELKNDIFHC